MDAVPLDRQRTVAHFFFPFACAFVATLCATVAGRPAFVSAAWTLSYFGDFAFISILRIPR